MTQTNPTTNPERPMQALAQQFLSTRASTPALIARVVAGVPLVGIGLQHQSGAAPLLPIIQGTPLPFPELNALVGPVLQVIGGLLLLSGAFARAGALLGLGAMAVALFSHATFAPYVPVGATEAVSWPDEPPIALPLAVLAASAFVALRGAGRLSFDLGLGGRRTAALMIALLGLVSVPGLGWAEAPEPAAARKHYDLDDGLGLQGYDAVAYFTEGRAREGRTSITADFEGVTYRFVSEANRDRFQEAPDRYRPAYGGWCAWAMAQGGQTSPDPTNFIVEDGRLFLFYKNFFIDTKTRWQAGDPPALERDADGEWANRIRA